MPIGRVRQEPRHSELPDSRFPDLRLAICNSSNLRFPCDLPCHTPLLEWGYEQAAHRRRPTHPTSTGRRFPAANWKGSAHGRCARPAGHSARAAAQDASAASKPALCFQCYRARVRAEPEDQGRRRAGYGFRGPLPGRHCRSSRSIRRGWHGSRPNGSSPGRRRGSASAATPRSGAAHRSRRGTHSPVSSGAKQRGSRIAGHADGARVGHRGRGARRRTPACPSRGCHSSSRDDAHAILTAHVDLIHHRPGCSCPGAGRASSAGSRHGRPPHACRLRSRTSAQRTLSSCEPGSARNSRSAMRSARSARRRCRRTTRRSCSWRKRVCGRRAPKQQPTSMPRKKAIEDLLAPMAKTLERVDTEVRDAERRRHQESATLLQHVAMLDGSSRDLQAETRRLVDALKRPGVRGRWGELQLKRVVELAGMTDHCDFIEQQTLAGNDRRIRPDVIIQLARRQDGHRRREGAARCLSAGARSAGRNRAPGAPGRSRAPGSQPSLSARSQELLHGRSGQPGVRRDVPAGRDVLQCRARAGSDAHRVRRGPQGHPGEPDHADRAAARRRLRMAAGGDGGERAPDQRARPQPVRVGSRACEALLRPGLAAERRASMPTTRRSDRSKATCS